MKTARLTPPARIPWWGYIAYPAAGVTLLAGLAVVTLAGLALWPKGSPPDVARGGATVAPATVPKARQTYTREEIREFMNWNLTEEAVQKKFGRPDKTAENTAALTAFGGNGGGGHERTVTYYYHNLSVDAAGSGTTDRLTVIKFGVIGERVEFVP